MHGYCLRNPKRAIRAIAGLDFQDSTSLKNLYILKMSDLFKFQYESLMWDHDHGSLPSAFKGSFDKVIYVHSSQTLHQKTNLQKRLISKR